jgi:formyl-CoA transferase/CoA:oxalate CoA-transferase
MRKNTDYLYDRMIEAFLQKTSAQWAEILEPLDIAFEVLAENWEVSKDPQVWANGCLTRMECPNGSTYVVSNTPVDFEGAERTQTRHAGRIGCDTREVLTSLGYTPEQIEDLLARSIAKAPN